MERIFGTQNAGYGQIALGVARSVKTKVSSLFTALKLPKPLVNVLTWGVLIGLGLMLAGLIAFVTFVYFMLTSKSGSDSMKQEDENESSAATMYSPEHSHLEQNIYHAEYLGQIEYAENLHK
ncbi:hypothetical protein AKN92_07515 [Thiopseudomonas alkaliphila]|nr:hypothetical protein AKN92_07515 [Thiopseudomonas alkaliphila]